MPYRRTSNQSINIGEDRRLSFYAALYSQPTELTEDGRTYTEQIAPGAFDDYLKGTGEVIANINHLERLTFAKRSDSTLLLQSDEKGLFASCYLPRTETGEHILKLTRKLWAAVAAFEHDTGGRVIFPTQFRQNFCDWHRLNLAKGQVISVDSVDYYDADDDPNQVRHLGIERQQTRVLTEGHELDN